MSLMLVDPQFEEETRERVVGFLVFFSSLECQQACGHLVEQGRMTYELCRIWFDEIYTPGISYMESLKGDFSEKAAEKFLACFSADEVKLLERFHRFLELRLDMLSDKQRAAGSFPTTDAWQQLMKDAWYLLEELDPEAERRKMILEGHVKAIMKHSNELTTLPTLRELMSPAKEA